MNYANHLKFVILILIFLILCTYYYFYNKKQENQIDGIKLGLKKRIKNILFWDIETTHQKNWRFEQDPITPQHLERFGCEETKCLLTNNRNLLSDHSHFDAILFNMSARTKEYPTKRNGQQVYIAVATDTPYLTINPHIKIQNFFNLTMSYRLDSDIAIPFGYIRDIETNKIIAPTNEIPWKQPDPDYYDDKFLKKFQESTKDLIWFSSECDKTSSGKMLFANHLENFIMVHMYGECGKLECNKNNGSCDKLAERYLFRGALESYYCNDFVTEKTFEDFAKTNSLMIVFGGANYEKFFPPNSYIDAKSFQSMGDLGTYLQKLKTHPIEYIKYFWWKNYYKVDEDTKSNENKFCSLCKKIHEPQIQSQVNIVQNFYRWFYKDSCSSPPPQLLYGY